MVYLAVTSHPGVREMQAPPPKVLLTGQPGVGKTTVIRRFLEGASGGTCRGFYTQELREGGQRVGFLAVTLEGEQITLAHVSLPRRWAVGRYGVDVRAFEEKIVPTLTVGAEPVDLVVVDEIGKMECFSPLFREAVWQALAGPVPVLGTIARRGGGFIQQVQAHPAVELVEVTRRNRDALPEALLARFRGWWSLEAAPETEEMRR